MARILAVAFLLVALVASAMGMSLRLDVTNNYSHRVTLQNGCGGKNLQLICRPQIANDKIKVEGNVYSTKSINDNKVLSSVNIQTITGAFAFGAKRA